MRLERVAPGRWSVSAGTVVAVVVSIAVAGAPGAGRNGARPVTASADAPPTELRVDACEPPPDPGRTGATQDAPGGSTAPIDPGPLCPRGGHSTLWTGSEMVVWGGWGDEMGFRQFDDGAAFDPAAGTWRALAPSPLPPRQYHVAAWTGSEMLVIGGSGRRDGAAYAPDLDRWRTLPDVPIPVSGEPISGVTGWAWTGSELVVWHVPTDRVAAYSPVTDTWRPLPAVGMHLERGVLRWSGEHVYAVGTEPARFTAVPLRIARLDAGATAWDALSHMSLTTEELGISAAPELTAWAGGRLIAWTDAGTDGRVVAFDPEVDQWVPAAPMPLAGCEGAPEPLVLDGRVLAFGWCGGTAIHDPGSDTWIRVDPEVMGDARYAVWTGQEVINWGDTCCYGTGGAPFTVRAWRHEPPAPG